MIDIADLADFAHLPAASEWRDQEMSLRSILCPKRLGFFSPAF
jgi:hypothetical protein